MSTKVTNVIITIGAILYVIMMMYSLVNDALSGNRPWGIMGGIAGVSIYNLRRKER